MGRERGLIKGSGGQERDATLNQVSEYNALFLVFEIVYTDLIYDHLGEI